MREEFFFWRLHEQAGRRRSLSWGGSYSWNKYLRQLWLWFLKSTSWFCPVEETRLWSPPPSALNQACVKMKVLVLHGLLPFHNSLKSTPYKAQKAPQTCLVTLGHSFLSHLSTRTKSIRGVVDLSTLLPSVFFDLIMGRMKNWALL